MPLFKRLHPRRRIGFVLVVVVALLCLGFTLIVNCSVHNGKQTLIYPIEKCPPAHTAIVLGAAVWGNRYLSHVLEDRVLTAIALYKAGKVKKLLMSGAHHSRHYDEVNNMRRYAEARGVPTRDIFMDHAGFTTYESMYRAREIFRVRKAIIVTQAYHLPRAIYIARGLGLEAVGVAADRRSYLNIRTYKIREYFATLKAWWQVAITRPQPTYLGKTHPITGDGRSTHDGK